MATKQHNDEMNLAWQFIEGTDVSVFLTGKAGTGKTTFLKRIKELAPKRMVVVAPTGVAAINAQGVTIHSFFQLPLGVHIPGTQYKEQGSHFRMSDEKKNILRTLDLLVIDEISMVRADLLDAVDSVLRKYRDRYKPFGGVQLLMIGDLQQLAPVAVEKEWALLRDYYPTPYFFSSRALQQIQYITIELQHIYRQSDAHFINLLGNIRSGRLDAQTIAALNARYIPNYEPCDGEESIRLTTHNYMANRYNEQKLAALPSEERHFEAVVKGDFPETSFPADFDLTLKEGAQVMFIKNESLPNPAEGGAYYYNGKMGKIVGFEEGCVMVECKENGTSDGDGAASSVVFAVETATWENTRMTLNAETNEIEEEVIGTFQQFPLRLAWAITVHKSQGLTFGHAVLDINDAFAHGQVYVALSRCRSLEGLVLTRPVEIKSLLTDQNVNAFINNELKSSENVGSQLNSFRFAYYQKLLDELFSFDLLGRSVRYVVRVLEEHLSRQQKELTAAWKQASADFDTNITTVAGRFQPQYHSILAQSQDYQNDPLLAERIAKASAYFVAQLQPVAELIAKTKPEIGNKAVAKQFKNALDTASLDLRGKLGTLERVVAHGFSTRTYLRDKANALLNEAKDAKPARKKKAEKVPKPKTWEISYALFREGKKVKEIAQERQLTQKTVFSHLMRYVESGDLQPLDLIPIRHVEAVRRLLARTGKPDDLFSFYKLLPSGILYDEMKVILEIL
ncbi:MAG: AAA family ATPase [Bacteroidales bacterium]|nr:AAA family ATPase [Bacteroidales bacterium]